MSGFSLSPCHTNVKTDMSDPIDVVYTWVDDSFAGYSDTLQAHADDPRDASPNRTRDNLETLRYSLRSLERFAPFVRRVHLLTCRPQVPAWLDTARDDIRVVHHDEIMDPAILPTFSSFAIVSHLSKLPDLSERFLYFEDDMLAFAPLKAADFMTSDGRARMFMRRKHAPVRDKVDPGRSSPWDLALATANEALDRAHGKERRNYLAHGPILIDRAVFDDMLETFPREIDATRRARFRADGTIPPEYVYPQHALKTGRAERASLAEVHRMAGYASLENILPWTVFQLRRLEWRKPCTITLNDSFGTAPNPRVVAHVRKTLEKWFPTPSRFERRDF
ncbi:MAG: hypothetical protein CMN86_07950 [Stappia sp.]|nr:hypothetical protein [Stappia sp.]